MKEIERFLKKILKKKQKYTKALLITFLMTGGLSVATPIAPNANGEYIVNSSTGDREVNISGVTRNIFKVDGKKLTFTGDEEVFSTTATTPPIRRTLLTISGANSSFEGTGTNSSKSTKFNSEEAAIRYSITDASGNFVNGINPKITLNNISVSSTNYIDKPLITVEARNGYNIKGAELNLIGHLDSDGLLVSGISEIKNWLVEVEGDISNNKYSELTVNATDFNLYGLMHKEGKSVLNVNLKGNSMWAFNKSSSNNSTTATINNLNIDKDAGLMVSFYPTEADGETDKYTLKLTSDGINNDGTLTNAGEIDLYNGSYKDVFTIEGNYHGNNGNIIMNTLWNAPGGENGENSESDLVYITGNASGSTRVSPSSFEEEEDYNVIDGTIQQLSTRLNSVPVIKVAGNSTPTTFIGTAKTAGAAEAQLTSRQVNGIWEYYWTIAPLGNANLGVIPGTGTTTGSNGGQNTSSKPIYIMAQPVSSYVLMPKVNLEMGYETVGTLHERRGENQILNLENMSKDKGQIWTRIFGHGLNEKGKERFEYESDIYGVQVGHDFKINEDSKGNTHLLGGYISYNRANTDFFDKYRAENGYISDDKFTGKGKSESVSLGLTKTKYTQNGSYYDLVGQMSFLQNKYNSRDDYAAKQKGYGLLLSAEVGRPFKFSKSVNGTSWSIEPQAQLSYQHLHMKSFNDGLRSVNQDNRNGLRTRAGVRISYDKNSEVTNRTNTYYAVANVWHDLTKNNNRATNIGLDKVSEKYGKTWGEIGIGAQAPVGQKSNLYVDTRYEHSFGNENRSGYKGTIGFKHTF